MKKLDTKDYPRYCYANHPADELPIRVVVGEEGFYFADKTLNVDAENEKMGVTPEQKEMMLSASIFGWNILGFKTCPRCELEKMHSEEVRNALSRKDNETYICSDCGTVEALEELKNG